MSQSLTHLLAQPSEVTLEQQPDPSPRPSPRPSPTPIVPDLILEPTDQAQEIKLMIAKTQKLKKQAKPIIKHHKAYLKSLSLQQRFPRKSFSKIHRVHKESVSKQGRKKAKGESSVQRNPLFDVLPEDKIDHMETEHAQSEGRTKEITDEQVEGTEEHNQGTEEIFEGSEEQREGTEEKVESTAGQIEGTEDQTNEEITSKASQTSTQTPTSMIFGDDETIATLLLNMIQAKAASKEKEIRSLSRLKPPPKNDPKDKGKKKMKRSDESESEDDRHSQAVKKFKPA
ncbi:hypothetical protein Tco_1304804 [Tanacetum coccineum]